jgi:hypothetical protein
LTRSWARSAVVAALVISGAAWSEEPKDPATVVPLTVAQATKAALRVSALPKGWDGGVAVDPSPVVGSRGEYAPAECVGILHPLDQAGTPDTAVRGQYFTRQPQQWVTEQIYSWSTDQGEVVRRLADLSTTCASFDLTSPSDHAKSRWTVKRLPGQEILLRFESTDEGSGPPTVAYIAYVVRGGTVMSLEAQGDTFTDAVFTRTVEKAIDQSVAR